MADLHHRDPHHRSSSSSPETLERGHPDSFDKDGYNEKSGVFVPGEGHAVEYEPGHRLHRGLKARHITMIAIGGAIGMLAILYSSKSNLLLTF
jgi:amino acid transporter